MGKFLSALFFLMLISPALADISVEVSAVGEGGSLFYPLEVKFYHIAVTNLSDEPSENVNVTLIAPPEMVFLIDGREERERVISFLQILPGRTEERDFDVKALSASTAPVQLRANYSAGDQNGSVFAPAIVRSGPLLLTATLGKDSIQPGEDANFDFSMKNDSAQALSAIRAELFSSGNVIVEGAPFERDSLAAGETISDSLGFTLAKDTGEGNIAIRVFFDDSNGTHVLEKSLPFEVQTKGIFALLLVAGVVLLVLIYFYNKGREDDSHGDDSPNDEPEEKGGKWAQGH
ncbi:MAG TPA: hypothetical protein VJH23_05055 [archaeon]|nr:hypothetical protein [archaeon]